MATVLSLHCTHERMYHKHGTMMKNTASTVKHATKRKAGVYACMIANLRRDVALRLVDSIAECSRVYPHQTPHTSFEAATAGLFTHYAQARARPIDKWQTIEYWAGPHEQRAMAHFLREPLLALAAKVSNDAHSQRYLIKDYRLDNGRVMRADVSRH
jgi:hypothetical protein